jgi:hypothetical protein
LAIQVTLLILILTNKNMAGDLQFNDQLADSKRYEDMVYRHLISSRGFEIPKKMVFRPTRDIYTSYDDTWRKHPDFRTPFQFIEHKKSTLLRTDLPKRYTMFKSHIYNQYKQLPVLLCVYGQQQRDSGVMWFINVDEIYSRLDQLIVAGRFGRDNKPYYRIPDYWFTNYGKIWNMKNKTWISQE